jgi:hypothetical protein
VSTSKQGKNPGPGPRAPLPAAELAEVRRAQIALTARIDAAAQAFARLRDHVDERVWGDVKAVANRGLELLQRIEALESQSVDVLRRLELAEKRFGDVYTITGNLGADLGTALARIDRLAALVELQRPAGETTLPPTQLGAGA